MEKKKVFLVGDSIRQGYDAYVRERLKPAADVFYPDDNCRFIQYTFRHLSDWKNNLPFAGEALDVIHWNAGLWDVLRLYRDDPLTPVDVYASFLVRTQKRIRLLFPNAVSVFALSTPVSPVECWPDPDYALRKNDDIRQYNAAARAALEPMGVRFDDLYALLENAPDSYHSDVTHFNTPEATECIGNAVTESILSALGMETC